MNYRYKINEEIARWSFEVYLKQNPKCQWYIAFSNPTAGPWKKVMMQNELGLSFEIHRFAREDKRPDLILINDYQKRMLIIEAKDNYRRLVTDQQMNKSIRTFKKISKVLTNIDNANWIKQKDYKIFCSFLWFTNNYSDIPNQVKLIESSFKSLIKNGNEKLLNIILFKDLNETIKPVFYYDSRSFEEFNFKFV